MPTGTVAVIVCQRRADIWYLANEQHGIAELVQPIVVQLQLRAQVLQQHIAGKRPHQLVVTLTALMHSRHDRIHHPKVRVGIDSLRGEARARRESAGQGIRFGHRRRTGRGHESREMSARVDQRWLGTMGSSLTETAPSGSKKNGSTYCSSPCFSRSL